MIPDINEILSMLLSGQCTQAEAAAWFDTHMELASNRDGDLRDHFAGLAMQGMLPMDTDNGRFRQQDVLQRTAQLAYAAADAMLQAREA